MKPAIIPAMILTTSLLFAAGLHRADAALVDLATSANKVTINGTWSVSPRGGTTMAASPGGYQSFDDPPYPSSASSGESFGLSTLSATASTSVKSSPAPEITTAATITLTQVDQPIISNGEAMGSGAYRLVSTVRQTVTVAATWSYEVNYNDCEPGWSGPEDRGAGALVSVFLCDYSTGDLTDNLLPDVPGWIKGGNFLASNKFEEIPVPGGATGWVGGVTTWDITLDPGTYLFSGASHAFLGGAIIPEPAALLLTLAGAVAAGLVRRR